MAARNHKGEIYCLIFLYLFYTDYFYLFLALTFISGPAQAADFVKTGKCLLGNCPGALASCLADKTCVQNLVCLQNCNGRPDESECQVSPSNQLLREIIREDKKTIFLQGIINEPIIDFFLSIACKDWMLRSMCLCLCYPST
jgi:hypothetical protein